MSKIKVLSKLIVGGQRLTNTKKSVVAYLEKQTNPVTVKQINSNVSANKTTIYRLLKRLIDLGSISEVNFGDGKKRYEISSKNHHHHLICVSCSKITEFEIGNKICRNKILLKKHLEFKVLRHNLEFFGICGKCENKYE